MKKFILAVSVLIVALMTSFVSPTFVRADSQSAVFIDKYNYLMATTLDDNNADEYAQIVEDAIILAESIDRNDAVKAQIKDFDEKSLTILKKYQLYVINYKLCKAYNLDDYSNSENGKQYLLSEQSIARYSIEVAVNKKQVDDAYENFYNLIKMDIFAKNINVVKTVDGGKFTAEAVVLDGTLCFSTDDYITISQKSDAAVIKNINKAILANTSTKLTDGGVAYYFDVQLCKNGALVNDFAKRISLKVKLDDLGLTVLDGSAIQIAKYNGNEKITLIDAEVENGYAVFEIDELGAYAICLDGYKISEETFFTKLDAYKGYFILALVALFITIAPIQYGRRLKRKQLKVEKQEFKAYKFYQKHLKKRKNKNKK